MEFFGVGLFELAMILLVTLIVVGPDRLPETAREIGKVVRTLRRYAWSVQREVTEGFSELTEEVEATKAEFKDLGTDLKSTGRSVETELKQVGDDVQGEFVDAEAQPKPKRPSRNGASTTRRRAPRPSLPDSEA
jgi:sec-independent protein translocase protein TatB